MPGVRVLEANRASCRRALFFGSDRTARCRTRLLTERDSPGRSPAHAGRGRCAVTALKLQPRILMSHTAQLYHVSQSLFRSCLESAPARVEPRPFPAFGVTRSID